MVQQQIAPYGSWKSPITSDLIVAESVGVMQIELDGEDIYWVEARPREAGRHVVVRRTHDGQRQDVTPPGFNARTRVHEYGGGAFAVCQGTVYFSHFDDQRLYRQDRGAAPRAITPAGDLRYADGVVDLQRGRLICVREDHSQSDREATNALIALALEGNALPQVLVSGNDFYASPRLTPDASRLAWLTWNHPNLPWDGTELWVAELANDGSVGASERVAGGSGESVFQPEWSPDGTLHFVSDRSGWWNLYRLRDGGVQAIKPLPAEFGRPQWVFRQATYAFTGPDRIVCAFNRRGIWHLGILHPGDGTLEELATPYVDFSYLRADGEQAVFVGGSEREASAVVRLDLTTRHFQVLRRTTEVSIESGYLSPPEALEFESEGGRRAYAFFYPPRNRDYLGPAHARPPLLVLSHGGPTSAATAALSLELQYWTSRGLAVLSVNYGGSTGYGRAYRECLNGQWGVVDVEDCVNGARALVQRDAVDGKRLAIRGGSAGGYTTLCALTFRDTFHAGASHFGLTDLEQFVQDTHKFESRYLDRLIGPYPERRDLFRQRSPVHHADRLLSPLIIFQGLEDKIVPPNQAELLVDALRKKGVPHAYLPFPGEQHGFRRAENIKRALDAELYFYSRVFGFSLAEPVAAVDIENLPR